MQTELVASRTSDELCPSSIHTDYRDACPTCGANVQEISNPYAGIGLAVHPDASVCTACNWVELAASSAKVRAAKRMTRVTIRQTTSPCASCRACLMEAPNPYYGSGVNTQPYLRFCIACSSTTAHSESQELAEKLTPGGKWWNFISGWRP